MGQLNFLAAKTTFNLIPVLDQEWSNDDWETPDRVARQIATLIKPDDLFVIEPSAGTGQIAQYLPAGSVCIEMSQYRCSFGAENLPQHYWVLRDFLATTPDDFQSNDWDVYSIYGEPDLVIGNPPFSLWAEFLLHALSLVRSGGRVIFVGPCDQFHKPTLWKKLKAWDNRIRVDAHPIVGRVAYLKDGTPQTGRQIYDSIFEVTKW